MDNPTKELCHKLDEMGVEYVSIGGITNWEHAEFDELADGSDTRLIVYGATPEQAIAATMGERNPDGLPIGLTVSNDGNLLNWVGENYVRQDAATVGRCDTMGLWPEWEQVLFANVSDEVAQDNLNECVHELLDKAATMGAGTCRYIPDDAGFTWWDENDVEHYEKHSASDECCSASCDKCGNQMMVGDDGWFNGWDEITEWWEEDGSYHKGYVLEPRFKRCPNCGARLVGA
jgi:hypothetical protein